jgi:hypothetical protein
MALGHRLVGVALPSCGSLTPSPTLPLSGGGGYHSPSSGKAGSTRSKLPSIAIILPHLPLALRQSLKPQPRPSGEASFCGASPKMLRANGAGLTGLDFVRLA